MLGQLSASDPGKNMNPKDLKPEMGVDENLSALPGWTQEISAAYEKFSAALPSDQVAYYVIQVLIGMLLKDNNEKTKLLDVGTYRGAFLRVLNEVYGERLSMVGVDRSLEEIEAARKLSEKYHDGISFLLMNSEGNQTVPITETGKYDVVTATFMHPTVAFWSVLNRVLGQISIGIRPGGVFYLLGLHPDSFLESGAKGMYQSYLHRMPRGGLRHGEPFQNCLINEEGNMIRFKDTWYDYSVLAEVLRRRGFNVRYVSISEDSEDPAVASLVRLFYQSNPDLREKSTKPLHMLLIAEKNKPKEA